MSNSNSTNPPARSSRRYLVASRLVLLLCATAAAAAGVSIALSQQRTGGAAYSCPMHPEVRSSGPGSCPICHMALETGATARAADDGSLDAIALANVSKHRIVEFVRKRSLLFDARELRAPAFVDADGTLTAVFYADQIDAIAPGERAAFSAGAGPAAAVRRTADAPARWDGSTSRIRFRSDGKRMRPGQAGWIEVPRKAREVLTVPVSAVLQSPAGPYVLVPAGKDRFEKRAIEIGQTFAKQGFAVVISGLQQHEPVVARASFFIDAERRLASAAGDRGTP